MISGKHDILVTALGMTFLLCAAVMASAAISDRRMFPHHTRWLSLSVFTSVMLTSGGMLLIAIPLLDLA
jgi:hypothetical protein